jgi:hypothetical protein
LGWKNLVLLVKQFDNKSKIVIKDILKEMDIDENTPRNDVIKQILSKISQYRIYKFVKKINDLVMFKSIVYGLEKGLDFSNRELLKLIKNSKRPDMVIRNFKKKSITESKSNQTKRTLYDESESIITKVNEILNNVLKIGKFSDSIDTYLLIKLYQNLIDADNTLNYNILIDMCNDDEHIDLLIQDLLK